MTKLDKFLNRNNLSKLEVEEIIYKNLILSIFLEIYTYLEQGDNKLELKKKLQSARSKEMENYFFKGFISKVTNKNLAEDELNYLNKLVYAYLRKSNFREKISYNLKLSLLKKQNNKCNLCGKKIEINTIQIDHIIPFKYVGDELEDNFQGLCKKCNLQKSDKLIYLNNIFKL